MAPEPPLLTVAAATVHHSSAILPSQHPRKCFLSLIPGASFVMAPPVATHKPIPNMLHGLLAWRCVGRVHSSILAPSPSTALHNPEQSMHHGHFTAYSPHPACLQDDESVQPSLSLSSEASYQSRRLVKTHINVRI
jgi:hypothetical protein